MLEIANEKSNRPCVSNKIVACENKELTFKEWIALKDGQNKLIKSLPSKNNAKPNNIKDPSNERSDKKNVYNRKNGPITQGMSIFFTGNSGISSFIPSPNNSFEIPRNNVGNLINRFNNVKFPNTNLSRQSNFVDISLSSGLNSCNERNNFTNFNRPNSFENDCRKNKGWKERSYFELPDNFFASDSIYSQRDMMQKPLLNGNPFRNEKKAKQMLKEFDKIRYTKDDKKIKKFKEKQTKKSSSNADLKNPSGDAMKLSNEPKVYVPNPKAKIDGKPYIPKPKVPEKNLEISKEEKKQQWKEYRVAMKPFKNRDFYNAKRVVQRLGKKDPSELEEKEVFRLTNARQIMAAHKARLSAKYANYIKTEDNTDQLGEIYILKKQLNDSEVTKPAIKLFENCGNFGENHTHADFKSGYKIIRGSTAYSGFVAGGSLKGTVQN